MPSSVRRPVAAGSAGGMMDNKKTPLEESTDRLIRIFAGILGPLGLCCIDWLVDRFCPDEQSAAYAAAILTNAGFYVFAFVVCWVLTPKRKWEPKRSESPCWDTEWLNLAVFMTCAIVGASLAVQTGLQGRSLRLSSSLLAFILLGASMFLKAKVVVITYEKLAVEAFLRREYRSAVRLISEAIERAIGGPTEKLQLRRAELLIGAQEFDEAVEYLTEFLRKYPDSDRAYELRLEARTWCHEAKAHADESNHSSRDSEATYELTHTI